METNKAFVRYISHELRTPLNVVFTGIKLALRPYDNLMSSKSNKSSDNITSNNKKDSFKKRKEQKEILQEISLACGVAVEILNEFLMFDKLEHNNMALSKQDVSVIEFMTEAMTMFFVQIREKKINLVLINYYSNDQNDTSGYGLLPSTSTEAMFQLDQLQKEYICNPSQRSPSQSNADMNASGIHNDGRCYILPTDVVFIDKHKLCQVIRNLLSNAIKFTPAGGNITVTIKFEPLTSYDETDSTVSKLPVAGSLVISVTDSGAGMSTIDQKRLFKEVVQFRPHELQAGGGSGIGLMITTGIVNLHGGTIEVFSAGEALGSTFTVKIPMTRHIAGSELSSLKASKLPAIEDKKMEQYNSPRKSPENLDENHNDDNNSLNSKTYPLRRRRSYSDQPMSTLNYDDDMVSTPSLSSKNREINATIDDKNENVFSVNFIRKQSQTVLTQRFSQYESLLAKEDNMHPFELKYATRAQFMNNSRGSSPGLPSINMETFPSNHMSSSNNHNTSLHSPNTRMFSPLKVNDTKNDYLNENSTEPYDHIIPKLTFNNNILNLSTDMTSCNINDDDDILQTQSEPGQTSTSCEDTSTTKVKGLKLLVVDDSGMSRKMMYRMLSSEGCSVAEAEDGEKAVEALKQNPFYDAILMDSHMNKMDGPAAACIMRSMGYKGIIIGITGDTGAKQITHYLQQGASRVLIKPVDLETIKETFQDFNLL